MRFILLIVLSFISLASFGQDIEYVKIQAARLASPDMSGRGYVDKGVERAADLLADEFKALGLTSLSKDYRQSFEHDVNTFPGHMKISVAAKELRPGVDFLIEANSPSIKGERRAVFVDGRKSRELLGQNIGQEQCEDCVLVLDMSEIESKEILSKARVLREALRGTHPVIWSSDSKLTWGVGSFQLPHPLIEMRSGLIKEGDIISFDICAKEKKGFESENVLGMVEGTEYPDSFVVFTAHYDHLGMMGKEATFYGANDNASGTAYILSLAKHYASNPAEFSTVFIAFAGEEAGLVGSKYFVENPLIELDKIRFFDQP